MADKTAKEQKQAQAVVCGPHDGAEQVAERLGLGVDDFWRELNEGRLVALYVRLPEIGQQSRRLPCATKAHTPHLREAVGHGV